MNQPDKQDLLYVVAMTRKRCRDLTMRETLLSALRSPDLVNARQTTNGLMLTGPGGTSTAHYTLSDVRGQRNLRSQLRRAGLLPASGKDMR